MYAFRKTRNDITAFIAARKSLFTSLALFSGLVNLLMLVPSVYMLRGVRPRSALRQ